MHAPVRPPSLPRWLTLIALAALAPLIFFIAGCATPPSPPPPPPPRPVATVDTTSPEPRPVKSQSLASEEPNSPELPLISNPNINFGKKYHEVKVFYATDRQPAAIPGTFGGARGTELTYGSLSISVPLTHVAGATEKPSIWKLQFSENPQKHMVILQREVDSHDDFFKNIGHALNRDGGASATFIFVHGYNVAFDDAARRTAQITYDLDFRGAPVFYSWPSQATLQGYTADENNVEWSQNNLKEFLLDYAQRTTGKDIYLIAHSMGNRALTRAVVALFAEHPELRGRFKEIILTAPDIDAAVFKRDIAPKLVSGCDKITLYVSDGDKALLASKTLHGGDYVRVGDSSTGIVVINGIETVDASGLDTSFLEHSYFATSHSVLSDIRRLVLEGLRAAQRGLMAKETTPGDDYWIFDPAMLKR